MDSAEWAGLNWKQRALHPRTLKAIVAGIAVGLVLAAGGWYYKIRPEEALNQKRVDATLDIAKLYGLQLSYKAAKGAYANDLDSLLALSPDGAALKASLAANVDMATLAVVGDKDKFKVELNVLDETRTPIKVKGPVAPRVPATAPAALTEQAPPLNADGAPLSSGR